mmetsp:Transcript_28822/g.65945  ORF Transcript_28822/g.65945 Transcript_28822/m.65945 type:complete len:217 (+) Transcript_28822:1201-1851(+)
MEVLWKFDGFQRSVRRQKLYPVHLWGRIVRHRFEPYSREGRYLGRPRLAADPNGAEPRSVQAARDGRRHSPEALENVRPQLLLPLGFRGRGQGKSHRHDGKDEELHRQQRGKNDGPVHRRHRGRLHLPRSRGRVGGGQAGRPVPHGGRIPHHLSAVRHGGFGRDGPDVHRTVRAGRVEAEHGGVGGAVGARRDRSGAVRHQNILWNRDSYRHHLGF